MNTGRRPTIPLGAWKIALNLVETNRVQRDSRAPAYQCGCDLCKAWKANYRSILPASFLEQLNRCCIDLDHPSELYEFHRDSESKHIRVQYHMVGKLLDGPVTIQQAEGGRQLQYHEVQEHPFITLAVVRQGETFEYVPELSKNKSGEILLVDMRVAIPG